MRHGRWILIAVTGFCCGATQGREIQLVVDLPASCAEARRVRLDLKGVEFPRNRAANIRIYARPAEGDEIYFGLLALLAESVKAEGVRKGDALRVDAEPPFLEWLNRTPRAGQLTLVLRPYAGKKAATDLEWKVASATLACR